MFDAKGRSIHYLRLSVTDLCNLRCRYCMPDGVEKLEREDILTYEEFLRLAALFAKCGVDTVRVTGGEPLVRKGVDYLVAQLKAIPGIRRVTMTTNGVLLAKQLPALLSAGLDSVNISLDTLSPEQFARITARDEFENVRAGIHAALESRLPVKLNCVPQVGVNEGELESLAAFAQEHPLQVRKRNGSLETFDRDKLLASLMTATVKRDIPIEKLNSLISDIESELRNDFRTEVDSRELGDMILRRLLKLDKVAYVRFASVYKDFQDLDGFYKELGNIK